MTGLTFAARTKPSEEALVAKLQGRDPRPHRESRDPRPHRESAPPVKARASLWARGRSYAQLFAR
jgi:hypothetical protein